MIVVRTPILESSSLQNSNKKKRPLRLSGLFNYACFLLHALDTQGLREAFTTELNGIQTTW